MGTVYGSIPFYYDEQSDDNLYDDSFEILRQQDWFKQVVKEKRNEQGEYPTSDRQETV